MVRRSVGSGPWAASMMRLDFVARENVRRIAARGGAVEAGGGVVLPFIVAELEAEEAAQGRQAARNGGGGHAARVQVAYEVGEVALAGLDERGLIGAQIAGGVLEIAAIGVDRVVRGAAFGAERVEESVDAAIVQHGGTVAPGSLWEVSFAAARRPPGGGPAVQRSQRLPHLQRFQRDGVGVVGHADFAELGEEVGEAGEGEGGDVRAELADGGERGFGVGVLARGGGDAGDSCVGDAAACGALEG